MQPTLIKTFLIFCTIIAILFFGTQICCGKQAGVIAILISLLGGGNSIFMIITANKKLKFWYLLVLFLPAMIIEFKIIIIFLFLSIILIQQNSHMLPILLMPAGNLLLLILATLFLILVKKSKLKINHLTSWYILYSLWIILAFLGWQSFLILSILIGYPSFLAVFIFDNKKSLLKKILLIIITCLQFGAIFLGANFFKELRDPCYIIEYGEKGPRWHIKDNRVCVGDGAVYIKYHTLKNADANTFRENKEHNFQDKNHTYNWNWEIIK